MSDEEEDNLPSAEICQQRCVEFAGITGTDEACAQFFLQDHDWDLSRSLNSYFEARTSGTGVHVVPGSGEASAIVTLGSDGVPDMAGRKRKRSVGLVDAADDGESPRMTTAPPQKFSFVTWNLDGLDYRSLKMRTKTVVKILETEAPDIVFVQELIPQTRDYLVARLPQYQLVAAGDQEYFTATLLRKYRVYYDTHCVLHYPRTSMLRNLLCIEAHIGPLKLTLLNTHLESTKEHADVRREQLATCFRRLQTTSSDRVVLLAGDLNLRDSELASMGGLPAGVSDLWERCGRRREVQFTWDTQRNTNVEIPSQYKPRLRFDRVYQRDSAQLKADHFGLLGLEKVTGTQSFPSDHWGVQVFFSIEPPV